MVFYIFVFIILHEKVNAIGYLPFLSLMFSLIHCRQSYFFPAFLLFFDAFAFAAPLIFLPSFPTCPYCPLLPSYLDSSLIV